MPELRRMGDLFPEGVNPRLILLSLSPLPSSRVPPTSSSNVSLDAHQQKVIRTPTASQYSARRSYLTLSNTMIGPLPRHRRLLPYGLNLLRVLGRQRITSELCSDE